MGEKNNCEKNTSNSRQQPSLIRVRSVAESAIICEEKKIIRNHYSRKETNVLEEFLGDDASAGVD